MRFIYTILLGMVIFQGMLIVLSPVFPTGSTNVGDYAVDPGDIETDPSGDYSYDSTKFKDVSNVGDIILSSFTNWYTLAIIAAFVAASGVTGAFLGGVRNVPMALGVGLFIGVIASIWNSTIGYVTNLTNNNVYISGVFTITTVGIGILIVFLVAEFFMGQTQGVN